MSAGPGITVGTCVGWSVRAVASPLCNTANEGRSTTNSRDGIISHVR